MTVNLALAPNVDTSDAPKIALGDVEFYIPKLMFRQTSKIEPHLPAALAYLNRAQAALAAVPKRENPKTGAIEVDADAPPEVLATFLSTVGMSEDESAALIRVVHAGITRAHPHVHLNDLLDLPIEGSELREALGVVMTQSRRLRPASEAAPGEARATG